MKKLILLLLALITLTASAQKVGLSVDPAKQGVGLIVESFVMKNISIIAGLEQGSYKDDMILVKVKIHTIGLRYKWFTLSYANNKVVTINNNYKRDIKFYKNSFELGGITDITDFVDSGIVYDPLNKHGKIVVLFKIK